METLKKSIVFCGAMFYRPNIDAVMWFIDNVFPLLDESIDFVIVGNKPTKEIISLQDKSSRIKVTGFVEDTKEYISNSLAMVAPMITGGGIQNKILEGMSCGKVTITSSLGAKPIIGAKHMEHLVSIDEPYDIAMFINSLLEKDYSYIGRNAQKLVRDYYSWEKYGNDLSEIINEKLLND